jgi:hypothetical protein
MTPTPQYLKEDLALTYLAYLYQFLGIEYVMQLLPEYNKETQQKLKLTQIEKRAEYLEYAYLEGWITREEIEVHKDFLKKHNVELKA